MRIPIALGLVAALAACATLMRGVDPQTATLATSIHDEAESFYTALAAKSAPDCDLDHNAAGYDRLDTMAAQLQARITEAKGSAALDRAAKALSQAIIGARESHMLASANAADPAGVCLAAGAIEINRSAVARASAAIASSQTSQGDQ